MARPPSLTRQLASRLLVLSVLGLPACVSAAKLHYVVPAELLAADSCIYPAHFTITDFTTWTPANTTAPSANVTQAPYIKFSYADSDTSILTSCQLNATSPSLTAGTGLAPRYACDNSIISFIWQNGALAMIEVACPGTSSVFVAEGDVRPANLTCAAVSCTSKAVTTAKAADGTLCKASGAINGTFTSLEPDPLGRE